MKYWGIADGEPYWNGYLGQWLFFGLTLPRDLTKAPIAQRSRKIPTAIAASSNSGGRGDRQGYRHNQAVI
ncbi:hypothetical protein [Nostoc sp. DedQUE09]|uniref:hypothetical protein n=1 Tax=Nostoc sp. DedQUE09 TaxID=3075394 RepID=UPI002AD38124|nr:hypothetical protein [Nostoc sp. DedQUE09]MDZ7956196.1 hypothetical protein [Nostoc sp. DedQUE09]